MIIEIKEQNLRKNLNVEAEKQKKKKDAGLEYHVLGKCDAVSALFLFRLDCLSLRKPSRKGK
jgi:hypothetical protein